MNDYISPPAPVEPARSGPAPWARIGLLGIAVAALIAAAILIFGATATPTGILAAGTTTDGSTTARELNGIDGRRGPGLGRGFGGITITALDGSSISLTTADGWTRTITVDAGTTYTTGGETIALGDLNVGDAIGFRQTREADGSFTIDSVIVILPHLGGEVTAIDGSTITVKLRDGSTGTINVTGATTFKVAGENAALADVKVGMFVMARGTENSDGSLTATALRAGTPGEHGPRGRGFHGGPDWNGDDKPAASAGTSSAN